MAKRELSSTLKNLKFMQRATLREETKPPAEEEKPKPDENFNPIMATRRRCIVIMEGNPHPGALKGRMSFQSFNPSIDKLNEAAENNRINHQNDRTSDRANGVSANAAGGSNMARPDNDSDVDLKRKQPEIETETPSQHKLRKSASGDGDAQTSSRSKKGSSKQQKRERLDWNILRPPKDTTKG